MKSRREQTIDLLNEFYFCLTTENPNEYYSSDWKYMFDLKTYNFYIHCEVEGDTELIVSNVNPTELRNILEIYIKIKL